MRRSNILRLGKAEFLTDTELREAESSPVHSQGMLKTAEVMTLLGYRCPKAFGKLVKNQCIPHVRFNARVIRFPRRGLEEWIRNRSSQ